MPAPPSPAPPGGAAPPPVPPPIGSIGAKAPPVPPPAAAVPPSPSLAGLGSSGGGGGGGGMKDELLKRVKLRSASNSPVVGPRSPKFNGMDMTMTLSNTMAGAAQDDLTLKLEQVRNLISDEGAQDAGDDSGGSDWED